MKNKKPFLYKLYLDSFKLIDTSLKKEGFIMAINRYFQNEIFYKFRIDLKKILLEDVYIERSYAEIVSQIHEHYVFQLDNLKGKE